MLFYRALELADFEMMHPLWLASDDIVCIHPLWPALQGEAQVMASWRRICANGPTMRVAHETIQQQQVSDHAVFLVREYLYHEGVGSEEKTLATNVFRKTEDGWRITLHHASPEPGIAVERSARPLH